MPSRIIRLLSLKNLELREDLLAKRRSKFDVGRPARRSFSKGWFDVQLFNDSDLNVFKKTL